MAINLMLGGSLSALFAPGPGGVTDTKGNPFTKGDGAGEAERVARILSGLDGGAREGANGFIASTSGTTSDQIGVPGRMPLVGEEAASSTAAVPPKVVWSAWLFLGSLLLWWLASKPGR